MVFFFKSINPKFILYMGRDKMENEDLIKHSLPIDVWFHVDGLSSAHVYARCTDGTPITEIPEEVIVDCAQLTKANSISGNKENNVRIVYTPAPNLKKTAGMADGQVSFHEMKQCQYTRVEKRINEIVNRLEKTKVEKPTQIIIEMREKYEKVQKQKRKKEAKQREAEEKEQREQRAKEKEARDYGKLMKEENITTNAELASAGVDVEEFEDGFM